MHISPFVKSPFPMVKSMASTGPSDLMMLAAGCLARLPSSVRSSWKNAKNSHGFIGKKHYE